MSTPEPNPSEPGRRPDRPAELWSGPPPSISSDLTRVMFASFALLGLAMAVVGALVFALVPGVGWWLGVLVGLVVAAVVVWLQARRADRVVLATLSGSRRHSEPPPRLLNMVDGLTLAGGVIPPVLILVDDPARNGMAVRRFDRNYLVVTTGLIDSLEVVELEGAVAELVTRLRNGDAEVSTVAAALLGRPLLDGPLRAAVAPLINIIMGRLVSPDHDLEADRQAVSLTRYPPGLINALQVIDGGSARPAVATGGTAHLWLVDPVVADDVADARRAPVSLRIDALAEL